MILRVHYNFDLKGGAEFDIVKLMKVFSIYGEDLWSNHLLLVCKEGNKIKAKLEDNSEVNYFNSIKDFDEFLNLLLIDLNIKIIHVHSMPYRDITNCIIATHLPVFRSMHEPMIVCPGWSKYFLTEDKPCDVAFGKVCILNAYTKKCTRSRNPWNLYKAYSNVKFEQEKGIPAYKKIFVYSNFMRKELLKVDVDNSKIKRIPSPQFDHFEAINKNLENEINLMYSGRLSKQKGVHYFIKAIAILKDKGYDDFKVRIFGEGSDESNLKQLVKQLDLNHLIDFYGWVDRKELIKYYEQSHISVVPSKYPDNFPNSVAESMLAKMVVIAFDSGGTCEWFKDGVSGTKANTKDEFSLAESIEKILINKELIESIGSRAREEILLNHSLEKTFTEYKKVYESVL